MVRPRIADIASRAGVSSATASLVLGGRPGTRVSAVTARRVLEVAAALGYQPRVRRPVVPWLSLVVDHATAGEGAVEVLGGALQAAGELGLAAAVIPVPDHAAADRAVAATLAEAPADRVVVVAGAGTAIDVAALNPQRVVLVSCRPDSDDDGLARCPVVEPDDADAARRAALALAGDARTSVTVVAGDDAAVAGRAWQRALRETRTGAGGLAVVSARLTREFATGREPLDRASSGDRGSALVCMGRDTTNDALRALARLGAHVPDDVVVHARVEGGEVDAVVPVTVWRVPAREMGRRAVRLLHAEPTGDRPVPGEPVRVRVPFAPPVAIPAWTGARPLEPEQDVGRLR